MGINLNELATTGWL